MGALAFVPNSIIVVEPVGTHVQLPGQDVCLYAHTRQTFQQLRGELFVALLHYHLSGENEYEEVIEQGLEQKLDAMLRHELYAQYKTAPTEEQREQARQEYLDRRGVPESFRW